MNNERYYRVSPRFWTDSAGWPEDRRTLALYLLTCQHRTGEGLFRMPLAYAAADLDWTPDRFDEPMLELEEDGFCEYDATSQTCLLVKAMKHQAPRNPNQITAAVRQLEVLPKTPLFQRFLDLARNYCDPLAEQIANNSELLTKQMADKPSINRHPRRACASPAPAPAPALSPAPNSLVDRSAIDRVFEVWKEATAHPAAVLDAKRRRFIAEALKLLPEDDVADACRGWKRSAHHRGENDRQTVYNGIHVLLRDIEQIEHFRDLHRNGSSPSSKGADIVAAFNRNHGA